MKSSNLVLYRRSPNGERMPVFSCDPSRKDASAIVAYYAQKAYQEAEKSGAVVPEMDLFLEEREAVDMQLKSATFTRVDLQSGVHAKQGFSSLAELDAAEKAEATA